MYNVNIINNEQKENNTNNTNKNKYKKLLPILTNKREIRKNDNYNLSLINKTNFRKFLLESHKRRKNKNKDIDNNNEDEFHKYTEKLEISMNGYQMSYSNGKKKR